jgi:hypothetical protein
MRKNYSKIIDNNLLQIEKTAEIRKQEKKTIRRNINQRIEKKLEDFISFA